MNTEENENILWNSKNGEVVITSHRIRKRTRNLMDGSIKSFLLIQLDSCSIKRIREYNHLKYALMYLVGLNGFVYLLNNFFLNGVLMKKLFGTVQLSGNVAMGVFIISLIIVVLYVFTFLKSMKSVLTFSSNWSTINLDVRHLDLDEIAEIIDIAEGAKMDLLHPN